MPNYAISEEKGKGTKQGNSKWNCNIKKIKFTVIGQNMLTRNQQVISKAQRSLSEMVKVYDTTHILWPFSYK